jgi:uncharacterized protein
MTRPLPPITSDTTQWWEATREKRLMVQRCRTCGHHQHYPRMLCLGCHGSDLALVEVSGRGTVWSFSVVHRSPDAETFPPPYIVALVRLHEGPVLTTNLVDVGPDTVACDQPVQLRWHALDDGRHLPMFTPIRPISER